MKSLNIYSKEQIDEKLSDIEATLPPSTLDDVNKALIVDDNGEPKWTSIDSDLPPSTIDDVNKALIVDDNGEPKWTAMSSSGKIRRAFTSLSDFTTYLSTAYLNVGDTLHVCCIGSYQALDFDVVINSRQTDISDTDPGYTIPCSGVATYTHLNNGNLTKTTHIVYEAEVGAFNNIMYMNYTANGNTINYTGVGTSDIIGADVVYFMAVLITEA